MVRTRRPGDYIVLADKSHKALNRFMIDEKIPRQDVYKRQERGNRTETVVMIERG